MISEAAGEKGIVMVTLQLLIDNAIKHNEIHTQFPLSIEIFDKDDYLIVKNKKQVRKVMTSNKQGLLQLIELYEFLSPHPVLIHDEAEFFIVKIPLL